MLFTNQSLALIPAVEALARLHVKMITDLCHEHLSTASRHRSTHRI